MTKAILKQYVPLSAEKKLLLTECELLRQELQTNKKKISKIDETKETIETYIKNINDPLMRNILYNRYILNKTWISVSIALGGYVSDDTLRKMSDRYIEKN